MNSFASSEYSKGGYVIATSRSTTNSWAQSHFSTNGYQYLYHMQSSSIGSAVWDNYGYSGSQPYKAVVDRDGYVRFAGPAEATAQACTLECLGE